ncbi:MAG TPA: hypothetical protein VFR86_25490 [Burkholderiaceae bacterium]|nr:hypothetical protein [Burkholderiaceae bacterium]
MRSFEAGDRPILATSAVFEPNGDLLYFLKDENIGGLFRREAESGKELRLLLRQHLQLSDLSLSPDGAMLAASSQQSAGVANIAVLQSDGSNCRDVTGGDTVDSAPAWIPGVPNRLLFQSAGFARDAQGYVVALGPASIMKLDMGEERVLATNVASYDVSPDGMIVYSNGRGVFVLDQHGSCELALADELVTEVVAAAA